MTLLDEFLDSIQDLSLEQIIRDIEIAREDSKNSYIMDDCTEEYEQEEEKAFDIEKMQPRFCSLKDEISNNVSNPLYIETMEASETRRLQSETSLAQSMVITKRGTEAA